MTIYKTNYDGFFIVKENGSYSTYEGYNLCPKNVQNMIDAGNYTSIDSTWLEAIQYCYI